ncbi:MAG: hypothetical protein IH950_16350 [Bacteroidetes bacterium]|nr:hypothetical protein [Bacteroidota bacterium]
MKNFEIVTLSDHNRNSYRSLGQIDTIGGIIRDIFGIFGGGDTGGLPGDYNSRIEQMVRLARDRGVIECIDYNKIATIAKTRIAEGTGVWQAQGDRYTAQLRKQKLETGSCQSVFGGGGGTGATLLPATANLLPVILIGGAFLFLIMNKK